jgi:hypothetical protein
LFFSIRTALLAQVFHDTEKVIGFLKIARQRRYTDGKEEYKVSTSQAVLELQIKTAMR